MAEKLKSSYELALEKLGDQGPKEDTALSPDVKARIAEARRIHESKIAELDIMHGTRLKELAARLSGAELQGKREELESDLRRRKTGLREELERKIGDLRAAAPSR